MGVDFGVVLQGMAHTPNFSEVKQIALTADELGFHSIWLSDHLMHPFPVEGKPKHYCLEALTTMSALGALTTNVKLGFSVLIPPFRNPAVTAKMVTTLDILSKGRLIVCLGAGWFRREFEAYGVPWNDDHDTRIAMEKEAVLIIKALWKEPEATFRGEYYHVNNAVMEPKPIQKPHPPIWIGGNSEKTMKLVSELAYGWLLLEDEPEKIKSKIQTVQSHIRGKHLSCAIALERVSTDPFEAYITEIQKYVNIGANLLNLRFNTVESLKTFAKEVLPSFSSDFG